MHVKQDGTSLYNEEASHHLYHRLLQDTVSLQVYSTTEYLIREAEVTATCLQQQTNDVCVSVFAGTHQRRGALAVLGIYIRAAAQEQLHHGNAAVAHREHECRLARLEK